MCPTKGVRSWKTWLRFANENFSDALRIKILLLFVLLARLFDRVKNRIQPSFPSINGRGLGFEFDEPFSTEAGKVQGESTRRKDSSLPPPCGPTDPWRGGIEKKMGWVIVGESLLSARVIVPGVGADFLSIGICTEPRSGCTLIPLTPQARIRSTHRTIPKERERERGRENGNGGKGKRERKREEKIIHEMRVTAASLDQPSILGKGCRKKKKNLSQEQIHVVASLSLTP